ncbi:hypothetical protein FHR55_003521 [Xanthomonas arboricola]
MPLERTFFDIPDVEVDPNEQLEWLSYHGHGPKLSWDALLQSRRVLIVSEAGMGKTYECKDRQQRLWDQGEPAFFIELAALRDGEFRPQLDQDQLQRFDEWKEGQTEVSTFFLDSVDEHALTQANFDLTLRQFARHLHGCLDRVRIVITTRPIPLDLASVQRHLPVPAPAENIDPEIHFADVAMGIDAKSDNKEDSAPIWRSVALAPLDGPLMRQVAGDKGIGDVDRLMNAINRLHAHDFAKRPLDFIALCADWKVHGVLRSHLQQIESDVDAKLAPRTRDERRDRTDLPPAKAREGAEKLALAALLTRRFVFWHSCDKDPAPDEHAIKPRLVLDSFSDDEVWALMERALFGLATYGRVRFHNRSVIEYLAARRLFTLRRDGTPVTTLKRLLFGTSPMGVAFVNPSMRPVAAWLAADLPEVLEEVCRREPDILLRYGDPEQLPLDVRERALTRFVQVHGSGGWRGQNVPSLQIQRFAHAKLAPCVQRLWQAGVENPEVRDILLDLIGAGSMHLCVDIAYQSAVDAEAPLMERLHALIALAELKDARLPGLFDAMAKDPAVWPEKLVDSTILNLYPQDIDASRLVGLLGRLLYRKRSYAGARSHLPQVFESTRFAANELAILIQGVAGLVANSTMLNATQHRLKTKRRDLIATLLVLCRRQLELEPTAPGLADAIVAIVVVSHDDYDASEHLKALRNALTATSPQMRQSLFWAHDALVTRLYPDNAQSVDSRLMCFFQHHIFQLDPSRDGPWLKMDLAKDVRLPLERELLVEILVDMRGDQALPLLEQVHSLLADYAAGQARIAAAIDRLRNPPEEPSWLRERRQRDEERKRKRLKHHASWRSLRRDLMQAPDAVTQGPRHKNITYQVWLAMRRGENTLATSGWNRGFLERVFNPEIADRVRLALMKHWREDTPTLRFEREPDKRNIYFERWSLGLAGLYAEAEQPQWARILTSDEAELAVRYALLDHRTPPWLQAVADAHPEPVQRLISRSLADELGPPESPAQNSMLLQSLKFADDPFLRTFIPSIKNWLEQALAQPSPVYAPTGVMAQATEILVQQGRPEDKVWLQNRAREQIGLHSSQEQRLFWFPVLAQLDMLQTAEALDQLAANPRVEKEDVSAWLALLFGGHRMQQKQDLGVLQAEPELLLRLVVIAYQHVGMVDHNDEQATRRGVRDEADWARNALLNALLNASGARAWRAKQALATHPLMEHFRDRARALANERLAEELDATRLDESGVRDLERWRDFSPRTRMEMATLLQGRLDDLDDLLLRDKSPREAWRKYPEETLLRREIAREITHMERNAVVTEETVTAEEKRTDIRLRSTSSDQECVIELKLGNKKYSVDDFHEALRDQLVNRYLAPEDRRVGCLLIALSLDRTWDHPDTGKPMDVVDLVEWLRARADEIVAASGYELYLSVRLLDLRDRLKSKAPRAPRKRSKTTEKSKT